MSSKRKHALLRGRVQLDRSRCRRENLESEKSSGFCLRARLSAERVVLCGNRESVLFGRPYGRPIKKSRVDFLRNAYFSLFGAPAFLFRVFRYPFHPPFAIPTSTASFPVPLESVLAAPQPVGSFLIF